MPKKINWTGITKGNLIMLREAGVDQHGNILWECRCTCGAVVVKPNRSIRSTSNCSTSCGVSRSNTQRAVHAMWKSRVYKTWVAMKQRCLNPKASSYDRYGGRGIKIHPKWVASFEAFYAYVGDAPKGMSLDRIDNTKGYVPGNVRWADIRTQQNNMRSNLMLTYNGKTQTLTQWAQELGLPYHRLRWRFNKGYPPHVVLHDGKYDPRELCG